MVAVTVAVVSPLPFLRGLFSDEADDTERRKNKNYERSSLRYQGITILRI